MDAECVIVYGSINQPVGGVLVVDGFDIVFVRVQVEGDGVVFAGEFEFRTPAVVGIAPEAERVADVANSTAGRRNAVCFC